MPLIQCFDCEKPVGPSANMCPHCGARLYSPFYYIGTSGFFLICLIEALQINPVPKIACCSFFVLHIIFSILAITRIFNKSPQNTVLLLSFAIIFIVLAIAITVDMTMILLGLFQ